MIRYEAAPTYPAILDRFCDWRDDEARVDCVARYDPVIRVSCRDYQLSAENADELCQRVWIDMARRMRSFPYDPGKTCREWLRRLCQSWAIDLLRKKSVSDLRFPGNNSVEALAREFPVESDAEERSALERPFLLRLAEEVQASVRCPVDERTWQVFW